MFGLIYVISVLCEQSVSCIHLYLSSSVILTWEERQVTVTRTATTTATTASATAAAIKTATHNITDVITGTDNDTDTHTAP